MDEKLMKKGRNAAYKLAFACFLEDMSRTKFEKLPISAQVEFATGIAELADPEDLISAFEYLGWLMNARANALREIVAPRPVN
jgi:hypothetical protein